MFIVTGGAGFIGSNIVKALNDAGHTDILVVDNLTNGTKFINLVDLEIANFIDKGDFLARIQSGHSFGQIEAIFHEGACSSTTEWDGRYMMANNYEYSRVLLRYCLDRSIPFLYASSAAAYGRRSDNFIEERRFEAPLNVYGYSKFLFDQHVRRALPTTQSPVCGFRYFNVYGPREGHKGKMASVAYHLDRQIRAGENPKLFAGSDTFKRDFVYVGDVVDMNLWCLEHGKSGIFNCGTGHAESFQALANAVMVHHGRGAIETVPFPDELKGRYQTFTQADLTRIRSAGYTKPLRPVAQGVAEYMRWLEAHTA